jgi:YbbR domain-containing protein
LFSFLLAIILWLTLIPEEKMYSEKTLVVPLELINIPANMEPTERVQPSINVTLTASNRLIPQIAAANVHAVIDLRNASIQQKDYPINLSMISIPAGAEIKEIYPSQVKINLEDTKEVQLKIEANIIGKLADGYELKKIELVPSEVQIRGPKSKVPDRAVVRTTPIDIASLTQSTELEVDLILPNPDVRFSGKNSKVLVRLLIQQKGGEGEPKQPDKKDKI